MNTKNKNAFLITCISCVVLLLTLCYFGINNSLKGTRAADCFETFGGGCGDGYAAVGTTADGGIQCCKKDASDKPVIPDTCQSTCLRSPLSSSNYTCTTYKDKCGTTCYACIEKPKPDDIGTCNNPKCPKGQVMSGCDTTTGKPVCSPESSSPCMDYQTCISAYSYCSEDINGCYIGKSSCPSGYEANSAGVCVPESSTPSVSDGCYSKSEAESLGKSKCKNGAYSLSNNQSSAGCWYYTCTVGNKTGCSAGEYYKAGKCEKCPAGYYCPNGESLIQCKPGVYSKVGSTSESDCGSDTTVCSGSSWFSSLTQAVNAAESMCSAQGKNFYKAQQVNGNCYTLSCCNCTGDSCGEEYTACWQKGSSYVYGSSKVYLPLGYTKAANSSCMKSDPTNPYNPTNPSNPNNPSNPSSSPKPSSSSNVTENPQTGQIAIFIVWTIGLATITYSVWYYVKGRKTN